jgi:hypothetical protein
VRIVLAIISFTLAAVMIVFGIAQRTFLAAPDKVVLATTVEQDAPVTVIDGGALNAYVGTQTLTIVGTEQVTGAYGRTSDVLGWIGDASYNVVTLDETGELTSELVRGTEDEVPSPIGSDLWFDDYEGGESLTTVINVPTNVSFFVVSDGIEPAPADISITWPLDNSTPWSGPLIVGGAILLLLGLAFLLLGINSMRRAGGPRRKPTKMPKVPRKPRYKPSRKAVEKPTAGRRAVRPSMAAATILVGTLALTGCSAEFWPDLNEATSIPTPSATFAEGAEIDPPAATEGQVARIVDRIAEVIAEADATGNGDLLATRMDGAALELRLANYTIRAADAGIAALPAIPAGPVKLVLPQQTDTWPRTVLAIIQDEDDPTIAPVALFLEQPTARENYKVSYAITLEPAAVLPEVAPADIGTARLQPDSPLLRVAPTEVALAYADILEKDVESSSYLDFEAEGDSLREAVGLAAKQTIIAALPTTAAVSFGHAIGDADPIVLATIDSGALIAVNLYETTSVSPTEAGAAVNPSGSVKALSGVAVSTKGVIATYGDQLLFYVPPAGGDGKIVLLGYSQGLVKASEIG